MLEHTSGVVTCVDDLGICLSSVKHGHGDDSSDWCFLHSFIQSLRSDGMASNFGSVHFCLRRHKFTHGEWVTIRVPNLGSGSG